MGALLLSDTPAELTRPTWDDVITEIVTSCRRRAPQGALLDVPGAIGVLAGPAPVVWAYDETAVASLIAATGAEDLEEIYVGTHQTGLTAGLAAQGWVVDRVVRQVVAPAVSGVIDPSSASVTIGELGPGDLAVVRSALVHWCGSDPAIIDAAYPDELFTVAAPLTMLGARDDDGRLCGFLAVRRQSQASMLFALAVSPARRRTKLATRLVTQAVRHASADGARFVHAQTNEAGAAVLAGCGFTAVGSWRRLVRAA